MRPPLPLQLAAIGLAAFLLGWWCFAAKPRSPVTKVRSAKAAAPTTPAPTTPFTISTSATSASVFPVTGDTAEARASRILGDLKTAMSGGDIFKRAERVLPILDTMTAEDFRSITNDQLLALLGSLKLDPTLTNAFADEYVRRWVQFDAEGALDTTWHHQLDAIPYALFRVYPEGILERFVAKAPGWDLIQEPGTAFESLAKRDVALARRFLNRVTDPEDRKRFEYSIAAGLAASDPIAAMVRARELDSDYVFEAAYDSAQKMGPGVLRQALELNAGKFKPKNADLAFQYPGVNWDSFWPDSVLTREAPNPDVFRVALRMDAAERDHLLEQLNASSGSMTRCAISGAVAAWAARDPRAAVEWAVVQAKPSDPGEEVNRAANIAIQFWLVSDKEAALQWLDGLPDSKLKRDLKLEAATRLIGKVDFAQIKELLPSQLKPDDLLSIGHIANIQSDRDPVAAADWSMSLPPEVVPNMIPKAIMLAWSKRDPESAANWLNQQPAGPRRDQFVFAFVSAMADEDPKAVEDWMESIENPSIRRSATLRIFDAIGEQDREEAIAWLRSRPNLNERQRDALTRHLK